MCSLMEVLYFLYILSAGKIHMGNLWPTVLLGGIGYWYFYTRHRKIFRNILFGASCLVFVGSFLFRKSISIQIRVFVNGFLFGNLRENQNTTLMFGIIGVIIFVLIGVLVFQVRMYMLLYVITIFFLLAEPFFNASARIIPILIMGGFQIFCLFISRNKMVWIQTKKKGNALWKVNKKSIGILFVIMLAGMVVAGTLVFPFQERWFTAALQVDRMVQERFKSMAGNVSDLVADGTVSRGNNYRTGLKQLEVYTEEKPEETLYLKGFSGDDYRQGKWREADDDSILDEIALELGGDSWGSYVEGIYYNFPFTLNSKIGMKENSPKKIHILPQRESQAWYIPYNSRWIREEQDGYAFEYYLQEEMNVNSEIYKGEEVDIRWTLAVENAYREKAKKSYTEIIEGQTPRLAALCEKNPLTDRDEITDFIIRTLHENATYSLTPGMTPLNEDVVDYFLFERKSGYCVHFASAAVQMYRMYGIPARYASGYAVSADSFELLGDNRYVAEVTDESAHAWVEIYEDGKGWIPVEVTPALPANLDEKNAKTSDTNALTIREENIQSEDRAPVNETIDDKKGTERQSDAEGEAERRTAIIIGGIAAAFLIGLAFAKIRRKYKQTQIDTGTVRVVYTQWVKMLLDEDILAKGEDMEAHLLKTISGKFQSISEEEFVVFLSIVSRATFDSGYISKGDTQYIRNIYWRTAEELHQKKSKVKLMKRIKSCLRMFKFVCFRNKK